MGEVKGTCTKTANDREASWWPSEPYIHAECDPHLSLRKCSHSGTIFTSLVVIDPFNFSSRLAIPGIFPTLSGRSVHLSLHLNKATYCFRLKPTLSVQT